MKGKSHYECSDSVLKNVVLHDQARTLGRRPIAVSVPDTSEPSIPKEVDTNSQDEFLRQREKELLYIKQVEKGRLDGFEEGKREGFAKGVEAGEKKFAERLTKLERLIASIVSSQAEFIQSVEDDLVEIAFVSVGALLADYVVPRDVICAKIRQVVEKYSSEGITTIRLSPADYNWVQTDESLAALLVRHSKAIPIRWASDSSVVLGGCVIECESGAIDARLESQLGKIKALLLRVRAARRG